MQAVNSSMKVVQDSELLAWVNIQHMFDKLQCHERGVAAGRSACKSTFNKNRNLWWLTGAGYLVGVYRFPSCCADPDFLHPDIYACIVQRQQQLSALHHSPLEMHFAPGTDLAPGNFLCINYARKVLGWGASWDGTERCRGSRVYWDRFVTDNTFKSRVIFYGEFTINLLYKSRVKRWCTVCKDQRAPSSHLYASPSVSRPPSLVVAFPSQPIHI